MDYDFSNITTEEIRSMFKNCERNKDIHCYGIYCIRCPFQDIDDKNLCEGYIQQDGFNMFKKELERREKMNNKMPELEAGMIVEWDFNGEILFDLMINESLYVSLNEDYWRGIPPEDDKIINIYKVIGCALSDMLTFKKRIWSKKSDNDIKIEEIQETIDKLQKDHENNISELKQRIEDYKKQ